MKTLIKMFRWILGLGIILFLGLSVGYGLSLTQQEASPPEDASLIPIDDTIAAEDSKAFEPNLMDQLTPAPESVDYKRIEENVFTLVNDLRAELGANPVQRNEILRLAADVRANEIEESFSHTRPNGTDPFTVLNEEGTEYDYFMAGENLAMATYYRDDVYMAELIFNGWVESEDHYETMINPDFKELGIGVHYDGEILYATQFFGTQKE